MLKYTNGAERAVGSVRLGLDSATCTIQPTRVCLLRVVGSRLRATKMNFWNDVDVHRGSHSQSHSPGKWICSDLKGQLDFYFSHEETHIELS